MIAEILLTFIRAEDPLHNGETVPFCGDRLPAEPARLTATHAATSFLRSTSLSASSACESLSALFPSRACV